MDFLKTPQQKLMEEAGMAPASPGWLHTPQQKLMEESGITPHFAAGGNVNHSEYPLFGVNAEWRYGANEVPQYPQYVQKHADGGQISPEEMQAALIANNKTPPRFQFAEGGKVNAQFSHEEFSTLHPLFVALGLIDSDDHIKYNK
jgi:hypothetical protein